MNECISIFFSQLVSMFTGLIIDISVKHYFCTVAFRSLHFNQRSSCRHNNDSLYSKCFCRICHTLCMVTCGRCDQSFFTLFRRQGTDFIVSTTKLVCTGSLHIFRFKIDFITCHMAEIITVDQFCLLYYLLYNL